jgi:transposase
MRCGVRYIKILFREILPELPQESVFQHISEAEGAEDMTRREFRKRADEFYANDILTPLERRRKAIESMKALTKEKIDEVKTLIGTGATKKEIAEKAGVGLSTVDRIRSGQLTAEGKPEKPKSASKPKPEPVFTAPETAQELITPRELDALRALIGQAVKAFAGIECATAADSYNLGQTFGLLTAAQMILEGDE